jgi:hypothetical protein
MGNTPGARTITEWGNLMAAIRLKPHLKQKSPTREAWKFGGH